MPAPWSATNTLRPVAAAVFAEGQRSWPIGVRHIEIGDRGVGAGDSGIELPPLRHGRSRADDGGVHEGQEASAARFLGYANACTAFHRGHATRWSLTSPVACMNA